jgi:cupin superfamily acireductone dioxygenase involved in methionine salvage
MNDNNSYYSGNAIDEGRGGWFVGQFVAPELGLRHQDTLEVKWGQHPKGECRRAFAHYKSATTISILVSGIFVTWIKLGEQLREVTLSKPGDYIAFAPGVDHSWEAREDCVVISVRFPSVAGDQVEQPKVLL